MRRAHDARGRCGLGLTGRFAVVLALACLALAVSLAAPRGADARFETGLDAAEYSSLDDAIRTHWYDETVKLGAGIVRVDLSWRRVTNGQPTDPANPFDGAYDFQAIDLAVRDAAARGLDVMLTIAHAPDYAEGPGRPNGVNAGTWQPDPAAFAAFGRAVASRYSGAAGLPRVRYYEAWNEANLPEFFNPQWDGNRPVSPGLYRQMLNAFYDAVKGVNGSNVVIAGATAPYGNEPGSIFGRMRPLVFLRSLLCLRDNLKPIKGCERAKFDILSHHPINTSGPPTQSAVDPDDASTPDLKNVRKTLRAAERRHTVGGPRRHKLWATELWWESKPPPNPLFGSVGLNKQARWIEQALYLLWKQGAKAVIYFQIRDPDPAARLGLHSGLFFFDTKAKPSARAFGFPFVTERTSKKRLRAWGMAPKKGKVRIQQRAGGGWRTIAKARAGGDRVFSKRLEVSGRAKLRAKRGSEKSLVWSERG